MASFSTASLEPMKCKLCNLDKVLRSSHIIPEFVFKPLYDAKHRFHKIVADPDVRNAFLQKGVREPLLCQECEGLLCRYEQYVAEVFGGKWEMLATNIEGLVVAENIDYGRFKLFALSILWRAGVSSDSFFREVSLGPHEQRLGKMLLANDPGESSEYPFFLTLVLHEDQLLSGLIMEPEKTKLDGHNAYRFVFFGFVWIFVVSNHSIPNPLQDAAINEAGQFKLLSKSAADLPFIREQARLLSSMGKLLNESP